MVMMTFSPFTCQAHHVDELIISGKRQKKKKKVPLPIAAHPADRTLPMGDPAPHPPPAEEI